MKEDGQKMLSALIRTLIVYIVVIAAMRFMGKRQLGELQPSELVTALLISNVASICIEEPDLPLLASITPIMLIAALEVLNASAAFYFPHWRGILVGRPVTVVRDGHIDQKALARLRVSANDLVEALRGQAVFTPADVAWGVMEPNGSLSVAPMPAGDGTPPMLPLLVDRRLYHDNLLALGRDEQWLDDYLRRRGLARQDVLLLLDNGRESYLATKAGRPAKTAERPGKDTV